MLTQHIFENALSTLYESSPDEFCGVNVGTGPGRETRLLLSKKQNERRPRAKTGPDRSQVDSLAVVAIHWQFRDKASPNLSKA